MASRIAHLFEHLGPAELLAESTAAVRQRRLAEVRDLEILAAWAAAHSQQDAVVRWSSLVQLGGDGTPKVRDDALGEIALARGTGVTATSNALADVLDLQYRLPRVWAIVRAGQAEVFIARRVARLSRRLPVECIASG